MAELAPIEKNVKISHKVVEQFKALIAEGKLQAGQRLPTEKELAETLRVSRPTLREALMVLEAIGYIEIRPREGSFVRTMIPATLGEPVLTMLERHPEKIFELFEVRRRIDPDGAALAAERANDRELAQLRELLEQAKVLVAGGKSIFSPEVADLYAKTFFRLAEATHNSIYAYLMRMLWTMVEGAFSYSREKLAFAPHLFGKMFRQYVAIVEAVIARDPVKARQAVARHLDFGEQELRRVLEEEKKNSKQREAGELAESEAGPGKPAASL
ncbi:MAG: FadR family transcriptional regulator [Deltaproteobacteria bacterium]|nr:FadR family transcriptional regulator [Deltaproteobacteria bacterium]